MRAFERSLMKSNIVGNSIDYGWGYEKDRRKNGRESTLRSKGEKGEGKKIN